MSTRGPSTDHALRSSAYCHFTANCHQQALQATHVTQLRCSILLCPLNAQVALVEQLLTEVWGGPACILLNPEFPAAPVPEQYKNVSSPLRGHACVCARHAGAKWCIVHHTRPFASTLDASHCERAQ